LVQLQDAPGELEIAGGQPTLCEARQGQILVAAPPPTGQVLEALLDRSIVQPCRGSSFRSNAMSAIAGIAENST
jgi:hypothetical protein